MKRRVFLFLFIALAAMLSAQDVAGKRSELEQVQRQIAESERMVRQAEQQSAGAQRDLQANKRRYTRIGSTLKELAGQEQRLRGELDSTQSELARTALRIGVLDELCREEFRELFEADVEELLQMGDTPDPMLLVLLINTTTSVLGKHENERAFLDTMRDAQQEAWSSTQKQKESAHQEGRTAQAQIEKLESRIADIEQEKQRHLAHIEELRRRAQALEELIARLELEPLKGEPTYRFTQGRIQWPVRGRVVRPFGEYHEDDPRVSFINDGIDIATPPNTEVRCADDGVVAFAEWYPRTGRVVIVDHQNGYLTSYTHNSKLLVSAGDHVKRGQPLALSGDSAANEEPVVHFELRKGRKAIDPTPFLE